MDRRRPAHAEMPRASVHTTGDNPRVGARQRRDRIEAFALVPIRPSLRMLRGTRGVTSSRSEE
jgi:hypothetical protein